MKTFFLALKRKDSIDKAPTIVKFYRFTFIVNLTNVTLLVVLTSLTTGTQFQ